MGKVIRNKGEGMSSFDTHDTGLAIALLTKGHVLIAKHLDMDSENDETVYHFEITPEVERDAEAFSEGKLFVNVKTLFQKMYELSARSMESCDDTNN
ncbi:MAG TPA: hypothetical protein VHA52_11845 [Candidatus Babeliaceae bacterium]|nr:hypothetical protein [Candidatus Babeliaceae bacterium]